MQITHHNPKLSTKVLRKYSASLEPFLEELGALCDRADQKTPYSALWQWQNEKMLHEVTTLVSQFKKPKHVVLVGIGGSSLGVEAIHAVLDNEKTAQLHILDTVSAHETKAVFSYLAGVRAVEDIVICVISKSGKTTETLMNAEVVLQHFVQHFGKAIYKQTIFISAPKTKLQRVAKKLSAHHITLPEVVSGRYSVFTPAGLVPLALLQHDIEDILSGFADASTDQYRVIAADQASFLFAYQQERPVLQLFVFDTRLVRFAKWYRQLFAESLGKQKTKKGKPYTGSVFIPTISTPVELHSTAQWYFSREDAAYTEFFDFTDNVTDYAIGKTALVSPYKNTSLEAGRSALYRGTLDAYQASRMPYVASVCDESLAYSMGLLCGLKMHTVLCLAELMQVNPFDQPAIETYKKLSAEYLSKKQ